MDSDSVVRPGAVASRSSQILRAEDLRMMRCIYRAAQAGADAAADAAAEDTAGADTDTDVDVEADCRLMALLTVCINHC